MNSRIVSLGSIARITSGGTPDRKNPSYWGGTIPWVKTALVQNCEIALHDIDEKITPAGLKGSSAKLIPAGSILMAMVGQGRTRGQVAILTIDAAVSQNCAAITFNSGVSSSYIYQQLLFRYEEIRIASNSSGQKNLNTELIRALRIPFPALSVQKRIAEVLAVWDAAIRKAWQLSTSKERRHQALIEKLYALTERCGTELHFRDLLNESMSAGSSGRDAKKITVKLYGRGVFARDERREGSEQTQYYIRRAGQLIYSKLDFLNGAFGIVPPELDGYESTLDLPSFDIAPSVNPVWLLGYLTRPTYYTRQLGLARGQRKARRVHPADLLASILYVPSRDLQDRIAEILTSSQDDIDKSKRLLESLKLQKRGLMQKLLTGEWRLPLAAKVSA